MRLFLKDKRVKRSADRKRILTWNSQSRSFSVIHFAISHRGSISSIRHVILLALSLKFSKKYPLKWPKIAVVDNPIVSWRPRQENPPEYPHVPYVSRNHSHWPTFLSLRVWVYLHSNFCSGLQKTNLFCHRVCFGRSRSSKVDDLCDFLLVGHCDYGPILHRFWDTATYCVKLLIFLPFSHWAPSLPVFPLEFPAEVNRQEARVVGYPPVKTAWS